MPFKTCDSRHTFPLCTRANEDALVFGRLGVVPILVGSLHCTLVVARGVEGSPRRDRGGQDLRGVAHAAFCLGSLLPKIAC
eukprot:6174131-Pleurochrysis_carterae.AAC.2